MSTPHQQHDAAGYLRTIQAILGGRRVRHGPPGHRRDRGVAATTDNTGSFTRRGRMQDASSPAKDAISPLMLIGACLSTAHLPPDRFRLMV